MSRMSRQMARKQLRERYGNAMARRIWQEREGAGDPSGRHPGRGDYQQVRMSQHKVQERVHEGSVRVPRKGGKGDTVSTPTLREKFQKVGAFVRGLFSRRAR